MSLRTPTDRQHRARTGSKTTGSHTAQKWPEKPRLAISRYLLLLVVGVVLALFFYATTTSTLVVDFGLFRTPLYPLIGTVLLALIIAIGWGTRTTALPVLGAMVALGVTWWAGSGIGFTLSPLWEDLHRAAPVLEGFLNPNWGFIWRVWDSWVSTIAMAIVASAIGCAIGLLLALGASPVSSPTGWFSQLIKAINSVIRSIPDVGYGLLFVAMLGGTASGGGPLAGIMALTMFNMGVVAKLTSESIDAVAPGPLEAADAAGASLIQRNRVAVLPQILPSYFSYSLYVFELNIRASVVLGIVGAGGIGSVISVQLSRFAYDNIAAIIVALVLVVLLVDFISLQIRRRLT